MQSSLHTGTDASRLHVAIIMDGNGRWAAARGRPRAAGHAEGARAVRRVVERAPRLGVRTLTLYAFSSDNWRRPAAEVSALMRLFRRYLRSETARCVTDGVSLRVIGRRDRLDPDLRAAIADAEGATARGDLLSLRIAIDYSSRDAIVAAATACRDVGAATRERFAALLGEVGHGGHPVPDVDLLIRTGGEQRLSDFLLWECAYAELYFTRRSWPEFGPAELAHAVGEFHLRTRRFGALPDAEAV